MASNQEGVTGATGVFGNWAVLGGQDVSPCRWGGWHRVAMQGVARRDVMLVCWAHNCPWVELTQPQDKRYLEPAKPQHAACFYFWVPQSPEMS